MVDFDHMLSSVRGSGKFQIIVSLLIGIAVMPSGMQNLANVFLVGLPVYACDVIGGTFEQSENFLSAIHPPIKGSAGCHLHDVNYSSLYLAWDGNSTVEIENIGQMRQCDRWVYSDEPYGRTTVMEWNLVCSNGWLRALASSVYMLGFLVGAIGFGSLADRIGRKKGFLISIVFMIVSGSIASFVPNFWVHIFTRLITGAASAGLFTSGFVLVMEIMVTEYRTLTGLLYQCWFALGYMTMGWIACALRDYSWTSLTISVYPAIFLSYYWIIGESPRWLLLRNRHAEAEKELSRIAKWNGVHLKEGALQEEEREDQDFVRLDRTYTIVDLLRTPNMRKKSLNIFFNWFVNSFVYYGLSMSSADLIGSPYLNFFFSGLAEFPGIFLAIIAVDRFGRRWPLAILMGGGGVACLITCFIPHQLRVVTTVFSMLGKVGISGSFAVIYVYSAELFPTVVRNTGVGAGSMSARVGGLLAPFVAELGKLVWTPLPLIIFGGLALAGGLLALVLPETMNQDLPDTLEEGELFKG
ncbi:hypothetical protein CAPTEDRAFT_115175 [Capitella teleta]|uniref:Major facilitator superfamily (MFS) profile domain-containing protein n=1 Tax=Capitella teleta TaxID=283909 RepID=R7TWQ7_CAPTE|nr:hypothetical protein CAPTEDRAFT_115175 [Capitella teleta]|eukprot:ELT95861.1 hypothetical protein CAPTEDRAFT_115175 [Capitella teleta]